ncbi:alkaline shock response membrane anchor protein AmaP [Paenibacillus sp. 7124]|uniref:Alkaline shock response membrane anchor protein AmaP n=1 Tax=Paenibacillus apii TaxID=1850370 RepID=A0A6M1PEC8_9BACL|nr:alkaline shock response membrane anchor protein AmaP [Paenibacillus apii]NGM81627.1 alkaline shock response membrane anchor protein AmaP [Paenibacillus apii]NJJ41461.1 alkaline shock response membrane anchor protein AmaP [Paenibacillus apii]
MAKILDRLLLFLYSLSIGALSVIAILLLSGVLPMNNLRIRDWDTAYIAAVAVAVILFLLSIRFFYISLRRERTSTLSVDQRTEYGDIQISMETIENLSLKAAGRVKGIRDLKSRIRVSQAGLEIMIRGVVDGEHSLPLLTSEIQRQVHEYVQETTGVPVADVSVYIANLAQSPSFKSRVE